MKVFKKEKNSGRVIFIDRNIETKNFEEATELDYQKQHNQIYLRALSEINF